MIQSFDIFTDSDNLKSRSKVRVIRLIQYIHSQLVFIKEMRMACFITAFIRAVKLR